MRKVLNEDWTTGFGRASNAVSTSGFKIRRHRLNKDCSLRPGNEPIDSSHSASFAIRLGEPAAALSPWPGGSVAQAAWDSDSSVRDGCP